MKKLALAHKGWFAASAVTDRWKRLFEGIRDECGFEIAFIEDTKRIPADVDVVLFSCSAGHFSEKKVRHLYHGYNGKRIVYLGDYQPSVEPHATSALKKADIILAPEAETYRRAFPGKRVEFFPYFFAPQERYMTLPWNDAPKMKCLVSGPLNGNYMLRRIAATFPDVDVLPHTGSHGAKLPGAVVRDDYAKTLNRYYCAVGGALRGGITTKVFEIMAAGALLINEPLADMDELGMRQGVHYVAAEFGTVCRVMADILCHKDAFDPIRRAGMEYARERHGIRNRIGQFRALMETI